MSYCFNPQEIIIDRKRILLNANVLVVSKNADGEAWILDSRCSFHMSPHRKWFVNYRDLIGGKVLLGMDVDDATFTFTGLSDSKLTKESA